MRKAWIVPVLATLLASGCARKAPEFGLDVLNHNLTVALEPSQHTLKATDKITAEFKSKKQVRFLLNKNLHVTRIAVEGDTCAFTSHTGPQIVQILPPAFADDSSLVRRAQLIVVALPQSQKKPRTLEVAYEGQIADSVAGAEFSRTFLANQTAGVISEKGVYLGESTLWYPTVPGDLASLRVDATTPKPFEVVSQGVLVKRKIEGDRMQTVWQERNPQDAIYLVAGPYSVAARLVPGTNVRVMTYFFQQSADLVDRYLTASARYIQLYDRLLGPYAYAKFAVVENFFPSGYGMPSFTLLGSHVIRLPFIVYTSLGHEICHNWWGNGVFVSPEGGNWCEGLTTYCADHYYEEAKSKEAGAEYRKNIDRDYTVYVHPDNDFPLTQFRERTDPATRAIGYGKAAMVFHQMRLLLGDDKFWNALRNVYRDYVFRYASWKDFEKVFQEFYGQDLRWFFRQWVEQKGAPKLVLKNVRKEQVGDRYRITVTVGQEAEKPYRLLVPVQVKTTAGSDKKLLDLHAEVDSVSIEVVNRPVEVAVDPYFDVFRRLDPDEFAPSLAQIIGEEKPVFVMPAAASPELTAAYKQVVQQLDRKKRGKVATDTSVQPDSLAGRSFVVFGGPWENKLWDKLNLEVPAELKLEPGRVAVAGQEFYLNGKGTTLIAVLRNPKSRDKAVLVVVTDQPAALEAVAPKLVHYGKYSYLVFMQGQNVAKGSWPVTNSPLVVRF
ncbi:MAG: M1 family metallopeptidase [Calditrichaeota bacterium]|nr:M1 family metallopeptidase [Calditrichota bacterium]